MDLIITTYGGGEVFVYVFNAIAMLMKTNGGIISPLSKIALSTGLIYITAVMFFKSDLQEGAKWLIWVLAATTFMTTAKTSVWIKDPITMPVAQEVKNVPVILATVAATVSSVGKIITEEMEQKFTLPDDLKYHKTGTVFASALMSQTKNFRITNPEFSENIENFVNRCVVIPAKIGTKFTKDDIQKAPDIWEFLKDKASPLLRFSYRDSDGVTKLTCKEGVTKLGAKWKTEITNASAVYGTRVNGRTLKATEFNNYLTDIYGMMTGMARSAEQILRQEMMINAIEQSPNNKLSELGGASNYAATKALLQQRSTYAVAGDIAAKTLPLFKNVVEAIAYALFVFVAVLALLPNGWKIMTAYVGILVWTQLWAPLYAVLNLIMTLCAKNESLAYSSKYGMSLLTSQAVHSANADMMTMAAWLSVSIPFLSYGILKQGAGAFVSLAQSLGSAMQSASSGVAAETVSGNYSMANVSMGTQAYNNHTANKIETSMAYNTGQIRSVDSAGIESLTQADGSTSYVDQDRSNLSTSIMLKSYMQSDLSKAFETSTNFAQTQSTRAWKSLEASTGSGMNTLSHIAENWNSGENYANSTAFSNADAFHQLMNQAHSIAKSENISVGKALDVVVSGGLNAPGSGITGVSAGVNGSLGVNSNRSDSQNHNQSFDKSMQKAVNVERLINDVKTLTEGTEHSGLHQMAKDISSQFQESHGYAQEAQAALTQSQTLSERLNSSEGTSVETQQDGTKKVQDYIAAQKDDYGNAIGGRRAAQIINENGADLQKYLSGFLQENPHYATAQVNSGDKMTTLNSQYAAASAGLVAKGEGEVGQFRGASENKVRTEAMNKGLDPEMRRQDQGLEGRYVQQSKDIQDRIDTGSDKVTTGGTFMEQDFKRAQAKSMLEDVGHASGEIMKGGYDTVKGILSPSDSPPTAPNNHHSASAESFEKSWASVSPPRPDDFSNDKGFGSSGTVTAQSGSFGSGTMNSPRQRIIDSDDVNSPESQKRKPIVAANNMQRRG